MVVTLGVPLQWFVCERAKRQDAIVLQQDRDSSSVLSASVTASVAPARLKLAVLAHVRRRDP